MKHDDTITTSHEIGAFKVATSKVNPDSDAVVSEIHIGAQPDRVFQALVVPEQVVKWWGQVALVAARSSMQTRATAENGAVLA